MILLAGWKLRRMVLRTSTLTKALDWSGLLWACFAWYSEEEGVDYRDLVKDKVGLTVPD